MQEKLERMTLLLTPDVNQKIGEIAKRDGRKKSNYIRQLVEKHVQEVTRKQVRVGK